MFMNKVLVWLNIKSKEKERRFRQSKEIQIQRYWIITKHGKAITDFTRFSESSVVENIETVFQSHQFDRLSNAQYQVDVVFILKCFDL